jgi:DNA polymerase (family 10)
MENQLIAAVFDEMADLLELSGENPFRIRAYRNGARAIRDLPEPVTNILEDPQRQLAEIPGIGDTLAEKTQVLISTGSLPQLEKLRKAIPPVVLLMTRIPGLGPKKARALHKELNILTLEELKAACIEGRVRKLKGFAAKTEQTILDGIAFASKEPSRIYWSEADGIVMRLKEHFRSCAEVERLEATGSYRRCAETVGDLDLLVASDHPAIVMEHFARYPGIQTILVRGGETKMSVRVHQELQVDLRVVQQNQYGAALQYFTGSKAHNVFLRQLAKKAGLRINEYGVFREGTEISIAGADEADVYGAVGLPWIAPELRENRQEFVWAESQRLPRLIERADLQGDLHMHTSATDGTATIAEMAESAIAFGLKYIAITDHSKRVSMARGLDETRLLEQWKHIDELRPRFAGRLHILKGIECDILEGGGMDLSDDVLAQADWVIASLHYGQRQPREQITERILGAIHNPHVDCVAHPTGRLIGRRPAYEVDLDAVLSACAATKTYIELNANPARLDLDDVHSAAAKRHGVQIVISSDAHEPAGMEVLRFGINQARRAGLTAADVANTRHPFPMGD